MISLFDIPLAARRPNLDGNWLEILIPVVIIIIYAVSGILKMRSNLKEQQEGRKSERRYRPLDEQEEWQEPDTEAMEKESARLERLLELKPAPRPGPARPRPAPQGQQLQANERRTLDAFLATEAPTPLSDRIAEARKKAEALVRAQQAQAAKEPLWPRAAERMEIARTRKPKVPAPTVSPAAAKPRTVPPVPPPEAHVLGDLKDNQTLRNAILYAEILGIPVALRDMDM